MTPTHNEDNFLLQLLAEMKKDLADVRANVSDILVAVGIIKFRLDERDTDCEKHSKSIETLEAAESQRKTKAGTILGMRTDFVYWLGIIVSVAALSANYVKILEWMSK